MKLYRVNANPTLKGDPAGPGGYVRYLDFVEGDFVAVIRKQHAPGVVWAVRLDNERLEQELDLSSLTLIGKGLKLVDDYL